MLLAKLTVREHIQFFSRLKGLYGKMSYAEAEASIDQAIRDVALEEKKLQMNLKSAKKTISACVANILVDKIYYC